MRYARLRVFAAFLAASLVFCGGAAAQAVGETGSSDAQQLAQVREELDRLKKDFDALRRQYDERLRDLEQRSGQPAGSALLALPAAYTLPSPPPLTAGQAAQLQAPETPAAPNPESAQQPPQEPAPQPAPAPTTADAQAIAASQVPAGSSKVFNPDTSVIANFLGHAGENEVTDEPSLQLTEAEVSLQAVVDPYARADFFLSASPEGLEVEEGYITFTTLPGNLLLKVGKMRAQFGKVNALHTHALPTADRPLVTDNLVGGEEGLSDAGMSLSHLIANPFLYLEVTGEVYHGDSAVFQSSKRSRLNYVGRVRAYRDLTEATNLDFGASFAHGPTDITSLVPVGDNDVAHLDKDLIGFDATFRYRPLRRAIYQRLNLRTELIWSRQQLFEAPQQNAFGFYGLGEYQFARRWYLGARGDRSGRTLDSSLVDKGGSFFITYWPSEFSQIRAQYRRTDYAEGIDANEFLFQFNFAIGAHGAHVF